MAVEANVKVDGFAQLRRQLNKVDPQLRKAMDKALRVTAKAVVADARSNASWSSRIPGAIGTSVTNRGVAIRVRRRRARHGSLFERGGKGRGSSFFRHPVFGNRERWVTQNTRPFLAPAVEKNEPRIVREIESVVQQTINRLGFRR